MMLGDIGVRALAFGSSAGCQRGSETHPSSSSYRFVVFFAFDNALRPIVSAQLQETRRVVQMSNGNRLF